MTTYDEYGAQVRAAYEVYTLALTGVYLGLQSAGRGADAVTELRRQGLGLIDTLLNSASNMGARYLNTLPDGPGVDVRETYFKAELHRIAIKNLNDLIVRLMGVGPRAADVLTRPAGAVGLLLQQRLSRPRFTVRDSAGRAWEAPKLVQVEARNFAYQSYVDVMLARSQSIGVDKIDIVYADPARNRTLALDEAIAQRKVIFHVNATAQIDSHVST